MIECWNIEIDMLVFPQRPILPKACCPSTVSIGPQGNAFRNRTFRQPRMCYSNFDSARKIFIQNLSLSRPSCKIPTWNTDTKQCSIPSRGREIVLFAKASRQALGLTQLPIQWAPSWGLERPEPEADHSPPSSAEFKNEWSYTSIPRMHAWRVQSQLRHIICIMELRRSSLAKIVWRFHAVHF